MRKPRLILSDRQKDAAESPSRLDRPSNRCGKGVLVPDVASA